MKTFRSLAKEPLVHFIILGAVVFFYYEIKTQDEPDDDSYKIVIDQDDINRLMTTYQMNWNTLPDSSTLRALVDEEIKSEIYYREAKRLRLNHNDEIVRRRMRQKYEFLIDDIGDNQEVTEDDLLEQYTNDKDAYKTEPKWEFSQVYFKSLPPQVQINNVKSTSFSELSHYNNFHIPVSVAASTSTQLGRKFGNEFAESLSQYQSDGWIQTPIRSGFGYHIIFINQYSPSIQKSFSESKPDVLKDYRVSNKQALRQRHYNSLKDQYNVEFSYE